jgi:hypothetical protein
MLRSALAFTAIIAAATFTTDNAEAQATDGRL